MPIRDPGVFYSHQADMRLRAEQTLLQVLAKSIVDGQRDNERCYAGCHADDGDSGDHADDGLSAFCAKITGGYEEFEGHFLAVRFQRSGLSEDDRIRTNDYD